MLLETNFLEFSYKKGKARNFFPKARTLSDKTMSDKSDEIFRW